MRWPPDDRRGASRSGHRLVHPRSPAPPGKILNYLGKTPQIFWHWGKRSGWDSERRGFGGFVVEAGGRAVMHAGDTACFAGFAEIGARFPDLDAAMLPIGAHSPPSFRNVHCDPDDALQAFLDLGAAHMVPIHWGTFVLSYEHVDEPMARVARLRHGETLVLDPLPAHAAGPLTAPAGLAPLGR